MSDDTSDDSGDSTRQNGGEESPADTPGATEEAQESADWFGEAGGGDGPRGDSGGDESPFGDGIPQVPGMDIDDASVDTSALAAQAGGESGFDGEDGGTAAGKTGATAGDPAGGAGGAVGMGGARSADAVAGTTAEDETRVLEFALGEERYCLDIEYVEEIVKRETVTRVPNTPDYVAGVVDLRGQITTILDPKVIFDIDVDGTEDLIVVFDPEGFDDQGAIGWLVDDVNQVMPVAESEVNPSPVDQDHVEGVVDRDGEFVIWTTPELAVEDATG